MPSDTEATPRWLRDIQHHISMAEGFIAGMGYVAFKDDNLRLYAVTRCLEIISEASRRLPEALTARHPFIRVRCHYRLTESVQRFLTACVAGSYP